MITENFKNCLMKTLQFEGGYSNDPDDPGAETAFGISRRYHPDWSGWYIIDLIEDKSTINLKFLNENFELFEKVSEFYFDEFYQKLKADKIEELSPKLACVVFDFAVNAGTGTSAKALQKAINKKLSEIPETEEIAVDGGIGNQTLGALRIISGHDYGICDLYHYFKDERVLYYVEITINKPTFLKFLKGWTKRAID